jgi:hypothetical protein
MSCPSLRAETSIQLEGVSMKKLSVFAAATILILLETVTLARTVNANTCRMPQGKDILAAYEVIFKGRAISTHKSYLLWNPNRLPDSYTEFEVLEVFKGKIDQKIRVYHSRKQDNETPPVIFEKDSLEIVFAHHRTASDLLTVDACTPRATSANTLHELVYEQNERKEAP